MLFPRGGFRSCEADHFVEVKVVQKRGRGALYGLEPSSRSFSVKTLLLQGLIVRAVISLVMSTDGQLRSETRSRPRGSGRTQQLRPQA